MILSEAIVNIYGIKNCVNKKKINYAFMQTNHVTLHDMQDT